jgi:hypothetical protein
MSCYGRRIRDVYKILATQEVGVHALIFTEVDFVTNKDYLWGNQLQTLNIYFTIE